MGFWSKIFPSEEERNRHLWGEDERLRDSAFNQLMENNQTKVRGVLRKIAKDDALAEETAQKAFCEYLDDLQNPFKRKVFALKGDKPIAVVINKGKSLLSKHFREEKKMPQNRYDTAAKTDEEEKQTVYLKELSVNSEEELDDLRGVFGIKDLLENNEKIQHLMAFFQEKKRGSCYEIFDMKLYTPIYSNKEIAAFLGKTEATIKTEYQRCKDKAREYLQSIGIDC